MRQEARRQEARRHVGIVALGRGAGLALLRDGREAVVGRDDDVGVVGEPELAERVLQLLEIVVGVLDRGERGRSVDAGRQLVEAVALIVLRAVRIARPEHQHERLAAGLEHRQHDLGGDVGEIVLLHDIGDRRAGRRGVAGLAVVAARRRRERQPGGGRARPSSPATAGCRLAACRSRHRRRWSARRCARCDRRSAPGRACRSAAVLKPLCARRLQDRVLVEIVAAEVLRRRRRAPDRFRGTASRCRRRRRTGKPV